MCQLKKALRVGPIIRGCNYVGSHNGEVSPGNKVGPACQKKNILSQPPRTPSRENRSPIPSPLRSRRRRLKSPAVGGAPPAPGALPRGALLRCPPPLPLLPVLSAAVSSASRRRPARPPARRGHELPPGGGALASWGMQGFATQLLTSSLRESSSTWNNRAPRRRFTSSLEHGLVVLEPPPGDTANLDITHGKIINSYMQTLGPSRQEVSFAGSVYLYCSCWHLDKFDLFVCLFVIEKINGDSTYHIFLGSQTKYTG